MITARDITFPAADGHPMRAAIATHEEDDLARPGVIVIHEIFGLNDDIRRLTGRVADLGYVALAPDLYDGPGMRAIFDVLEVVPRQTLRIDVTLPFGIVGHEIIQLTALDAGRTRVTFS